MKNFDLIVIGAGHAGVEAALVASKMGCETLLLTGDSDRIGEMSCNPAIGGLGKAQLVKEIDALFGEMALATDRAGIHFRLLNSSKGPAVRSSRAQADRELYSRRIKRVLSVAKNLSTKRGVATALKLKGRRVEGLYTREGELIRTRAVVICSGTFLASLMHTGEEKVKGGRVGDDSSCELSSWLKGLGLRIPRLKTGTPPRIRKNTVDYSKLELQPPDRDIRPFSFRTEKIRRRQLPCWITKTNALSHDVIRKNVKRSPLFNGQIDSVGPRYCPSIEDKVVRFGDRDSHNIFLEPEGLDSDLLYPNGISTSLPRDVQLAVVRSIRGLENAQIESFGYAVEYDYIDPTQLSRSLALKDFEGIFSAGQINGSSGYEEAAAQGIIAGINAAHFLKGREPLLLRRDQAYIGVMIDDLTTIGLLEPYRMFTSRAEHRLFLREDNADHRLLPIARGLGLVDDYWWRRFSKKWDGIDAEKERLSGYSIKESAETRAWLDSLSTAAIADRITLADLLKRPEISYRDIARSFPAQVKLSERDIGRIEGDIKLAGYLKRQRRDVEKMKRLEAMAIPEAFSYSSISGLRKEIVQRLEERRPETLGQASRIPGLSPAAVSVLAVYLKRFRAGLEASEVLRGGAEGE